MTRQDTATPPQVVAESPVRAVIRVLLAGTAVGFLTGLFGVGGGFVVVPALVIALRIPMPIAIGTSLLVIAVNAVTALGVRMLGGGHIDWGGGGGVHDRRPGRRPHG